MGPEAPHFTVTPGVNTCVKYIKATLFQDIFSAYYFTICHPTCCSANRSTFSRGNSRSAGLANAYMNSQKFDALLRKPCSYGSTSVPKMASEAISEHLISKTFLGEHALKPPYSCMYMHACIYIPLRHPCNPHSKNPGYGPEDPCCIALRHMYHISYQLH